MRALLISLTTVPLAIIPAAPDAWADAALIITGHPASHERPQTQDRPAVGTALRKLFPPPRQTSSGCTVQWGGGLNEGRFTVRRVTSC